MPSDRQASAYEAKRRNPSEHEIDEDKSANTTSPAARGKERPIHRTQNN